MPEDIATAVQSMKVILALTDKYSAAVMNPPYMGNHSMADELKLDVDINYPFVANDLGSVFIQVALNLIKKSGLIGMINQATWLFKPAYSSFREELLNSPYVCTPNKNGVSF